jgi:hypothetical protein
MPWAPPVTIATFSLSRIVPSRVVVMNTMDQYHP